MELRAPAPATTLRREALAVLLERDAAAKARRARQLPLTGSWGEHEQIEQPGGIPGRPERPPLVPPAALKPRSVGSLEGRAALVHALCHIELNAIDLAVDIVWRFDGMPTGFYRDWIAVAREEGLHFELLRAHLQEMGFDYGDFPAHNGLWEMAEKTRHDLLARLALVPRTLEARGLDASPAVKEKLVRSGDVRAGEIIDVILRDEIGHVRIGNHWYRHACRERGLDPIQVHAELALRYHAPSPKGPFNLDARRAAGFAPEEIAALGAGPGQ